MKTIVVMIIDYVIYNITRWTFFIQLTHTADDAKSKHVSQVQEEKWNNITKSCVYLILKTFYVSNFISWNNRRWKQHVPN